MNSIKHEIIIALILGIFPSALHAAQIRVVAPVPAVQVSKQVKIDVLLDPVEEEINAVEGVVHIPEEFMVRAIDETSSVISIWIERPSVAGASVSFSGIIPGGFTGVRSPYWEGYKPGLLFSLVVEAKSVGDALFDLENVRVLLHDGQGTEAPLVLVSRMLTVTDTEVPFYSLPLVQDRDQPEPFAPEIVRIPEVFDGAWVAVFNTQDKGSGIAYYEIQERLPRQGILRLFHSESWRREESPALLRDQTRKSVIRIKAVDRAGNARVVSMEPAYPLSWYENILIWGILIGILSIFIILRLWRQKQKLS